MTELVLLAMILLCVAVSLTLQVRSLLSPPQDNEGVMTDAKQAVTAAEQLHGPGPELNQDKAHVATAHLMGLRPYLSGLDARMLIEAAVAEKKHGK
jgi:hypothetical protein